MPGHVEQFIIESAALKGNKFGDPYKRTISVYLPPDYAHDSPRRYPLILMLPAHGNTGSSLLNWRAYDEGIDQQCDRLIGTGACAPFILVLPDTWTLLGGSLYLNSPAYGNMEDHLLQEVIPEVEARYRTLSGRDGRAVIGRSSGGYGAFYLAATRPNVFSAAAIHSADAYFEYAAIPELAKLGRNLNKYGGIAGVIQAAKVRGTKDQTFFDTIGILSWCASLRPNPDAEFGFDLPIDTETGALIPEYWSECLASDPVQMITSPTIQDSLAQMKALYIDCGSFDEYNLQVGARLISRSLHAHNIPHTYQEYPGGHRNGHIRYDTSLPLIVNALSEA